MSSKKEIAKEASISHGRVPCILHNYLDMIMLSTRRVPCLLAVNQKGVEMVVSLQYLKMFRDNEKDFLQHFITMGET